MTQLEDYWNIALQIFSTGDLIRLAIMLVAIVAAGFFMSSYRSILNATVVALVLFAIATFVRGIIAGGANFGDLAAADWNNFVALNVKTFLVYVISFAVVIAVVHFLRTLVIKRA